MSWSAVAKKDFTDALRSRAIWAISVVFILLSVVIAYVYGSFSADQLGTEEVTAEGLVFFLASNITLFVSITALVIAYKSIAGERESGSLKILLSLPHTRRDVLLGKVLGRGAVLAIPVVVALAIGAVVGSAMLGEVAAQALLALLVVSLVFTFAYVSVIVGLSAITGSTTRASMLTIGFFVLFEFLWGIVSIGIVWASNGFSLPQSTAAYPDWIFVVNQVPPSGAYTTFLYALVPGASGNAADIDAFYATPWLGAVVLLFWLVVPAALGYWRFSKADL
ncbi:ABC transporter permease subunit [Halapricum salinum]|uniref:ABC transporter n=1 Tax=Halapricum salinum TaxID=1457250 RepID=A0A4D6H8E0_9EURY|nr:ABC transporter permease subunit [Halapricum salinum]QCC50304.1 ABC transporter [Halapricum salinum]